MKAFLLGLVAAAGIAYGAHYLMHNYLEPSSADRYASDSVRL